MKNKYYFLLILFISLTAPAQTSEEANKQLIRDLIENSFEDVFSNLDTESLSSYYTSNFLLLENGEIWDREMIVNYMKNAKAQEQKSERINSFEYISLIVEGNMAWVAYHNKATFKRDGQVTGEMNWLESATAILTDDGWKLQMLHSTIVKNE